MRTLYKNIMGKQINRKAECLYNLIGKEPGFDIFKAVRDLGGTIKIVAANELGLGVDAKIVVYDEDGGFEILCAPDLGDEYTRFCIAHELGHLFLHMVKKDENGKPQIIEKSFCRNNDLYNLREWEAEEFAAAFLMPEEEFKSYISVVDGDISEIAKKFKVSPQSVLMRCKRLEAL